MTDWSYRCHRSACDADGMTAKEYHEHVTEHVKDELPDDADTESIEEKLDLRHLTG